MCGIAGVLRLDGEQPDPVLVDRMIECLAHRGPDGVGSHRDGPVVLGHRRLSILDPTPSGDQPMRRGGSWLVHNGEIYNFLELLGELQALGHVVRSRSDTEVLLAAYDAWGLEALERFNGMWAFALWDAPRRRLVLARDRLGVKPLYLRRTSRSVAFASEPDALVSTPGLDPGDAWGAVPDLAVVRDFVTRGLVDPSNRSFFDGVTAVPPGHAIVIEDGRERLWRSWATPVLSDDVRAAVRGTDATRDRELLDEFAATFDAAIRVHLRSDVPLGSCLSG